MVFKGKTNIQWRLLIWQALVAVFMVASIGLVVAVWLRGSQETEDAFQQGRRLLIKMDTGEIEGKQSSTGDPSSSAPAAQKSAEPAATEAPKAEEAKPEESKPDTPKAPEEESKAPVENPQLAPLPDLTSVMPATPPSSLVNEASAALTEKTDIGPLPIIGPDGAKPWRYYSKKFERKGSQPMIAVIVSGLGQNRSVVENAVRLPENVTLSFSPYAKNIASWAIAARANGHEIMIDLPLQPANYPVSDPGPYGLLLDRGEKEITERLKWSMSRVPGYIGFLTPQNEAFTGNETAFKFLLQTLANRGLMIMVGREPSKAEIREILEAATTANVVGDLLLDEDLAIPNIQARLSTLEQIARKRGYAVGVMNAYPVSIEQLRVWHATLAEKGLMLVPVSAIARLRHS